MRVGRQGINEEDQCIDPLFGDHGSELLIAAQRAALESRDLQVG